MMKHRRLVVRSDNGLTGRELAMVFTQVTAESKIAISRGAGSNKTINGVMVTTTISGTSQDVPVEIPDWISIEVPLFVGAGSEEIELDLLVESNRADQIQVSVMSAQIEEKMVASFSQMISKIRDIEGIQTGLGKVSHGSWKYL